MFLIDLQSRTPIYEQLYECVKNKLLEGDLTQGERLPSVRDLSKELGVNPNTVNKAFRALERDKLIYTVPGRGSYASEIPGDELKQAAMADFAEAAKNALRAGAAENELIEKIKEMGK